MQFVQPALLGLLAAVAIPIVIHLLFRRRSRKVELGTLRFLRIVLEENAKRRKLKRWLLLSLRMLCVGLLAVLFARPYLIAREPGSREHLIAMLIDRSASMTLKDRGKRLLDHAVDQARDIIRSAGPRTRIELAFFDQSARPWGTPNSTPDSEGAASRESLMTLQAPEVAFGSTNYGAALAWARDVCMTASEQKKDLYIFTDLQRSGLDWTNAEPLPAGVAVQLVDLGRATVNNVSITGVQVSRLLARPGESLAAVVTLSNGGPFPLEKTPVVLTLEAGSRKHVLRERTTVEPGAVATVSFDLPALNEGLWRGTVRLEVDDDLTFDNRRFFGVLSAAPIPAILVDGAPHKSPFLCETYFLETSLRLANPGETYAESWFAPTVSPFTPGADLPNLSKTRVVVLANVPALSRADAARLAKFVSDGGGLVVFTGDNVSPDSVQSLAAAGLTPGEITGTAKAHDLPYRWQEWDEEHPLLEPFRDPQHGDLRRLAFQSYTRIQPSAQAKVLARFRDGDPALLEHTLGKGKVIWFTSTVDRDWGDWTRTRLYLPCVHQLLGYPTGLTGGGPLRDALIDALSPADAAPGVFDREGYSEILNSSPRESETDHCTKEEFANRFQLALTDGSEERLQTTAPAEAAFSGDLRDDELWHWVVFALVGMLLTEGFLANRTAA